MIPPRPAGRSPAFNIGWAIGARIRRALIATRDILDEAFASPGAMSAGDPDGMTRAQLVRAFKHERDHALDLQADIADLEQDLSKARRRVIAAEGVPPIGESLRGEALDAADSGGPFVAPKLAFAQSFADSAGHDCMRDPDTCGKCAGWFMRPDGTWGRP
jgi:uncharacterized protein YgbK (DUF1537 family)